MRTVFNAELADIILARISEGETMISICKDLNVKLGTVNMWIISPPAEAIIYGYPEAYARARQSQRLVWAEMAADASFTTEEGTRTIERTGGKYSGTEVQTGDMVEHRKLKINTLQWFLARLDRGQYGTEPQKMGEQDEPGVFKVKIVNDPEA